MRISLYIFFFGPSLDSTYWMVTLKGKEFGVHSLSPPLFLIANVFLVFLVDAFITLNMLFLS